MELIAYKQLRKHISLIIVRLKDLSEKFESKPYSMNSSDLDVYDVQFLKDLLADIQEVNSLFSEVREELDIMHSISDEATFDKHILKFKAWVDYYILEAKQVANKRAFRS